MAEALAEFRAANYDRVYMRPASLAQAQAVIAMLRALVEHFTDRPNGIAGVGAGARRRRRQRRGHAGRGHLRGRHDRPLRLPERRVQAGVGSVPSAPRRRGHVSAGPGHVAWSPTLELFAGSIAALPQAASWVSGHVARRLGSGQQVTSPPGTELAFRPFHRIAYLRALPCCMCTSNAMKPITTEFRSQESATVRVADA